MTFGLPLSTPIAKDELAICVSPGAFGAHIGIAFHSVKDGQKLLHLRWHKWLAVDAYPPEQECWIVCKLQLPPLLRAQLVGIVRSVAKRQPQISYAVNSIAGKGSFDPSGSYKPPKGSLGLTCASFVTEIFRAAKVPLLNEKTWVESAENIKWANDVIAMLEMYGVDPDHVAAVRKSVDGIRIRPEEVGAAAYLPLKSLPADYDTASSLAAQVMHNLANAYPTIAA